MHERLAESMCPNSPWKMLMLPCQRIRSNNIAISLQFFLHSNSWTKFTLSSILQRMLERFSHAEASHHVSVPFLFIVFNIPLVFWLEQWTEVTNANLALTFIFQWMTIREQSNSHSGEGGKRQLSNSWKLRADMLYSSNADTQSAALIG